MNAERIGIMADSHGDVGALRAGHRPVRNAELRPLDSPGRRLRHRPECIQRVNVRMVSEMPVPGQTYRLEARRPRVLSAGALTAGWVMVRDRPTASVQYRHRA